MYLGSVKKTGGRSLSGLLINNIILLALFTAAGLLLLLLVHLIPAGRQQQHVREALPAIEAEFVQSALIDGYPGSFTGGFTDCLMLENAVYKNPIHSALEQALLMYRGESGEGDGWATGYSLVDFLNGEEQTREISYARYWHGYLVVLKPLLYLTNFNTIRLLQASVQLLLAGFVVIAFSGKKQVFPAKAFIMSMPFLYFFSMYASLSLSICYYLVAGALLIQAKYDKILRDKRIYAEFFFVLGMLTSYFDLLTYPLVVLGMPLCVWLYLSASSAGNAAKLKGMLINTAEWFVGYGALWAMKWVITDIFTGSGTIRDGISTLFERTGAAYDTGWLAGYFDVVRENVSMFANWGFYLLIFVLIIWLAVIAVKGHRSGVCRPGEVLLFLVPAAYPFIWYLFTQNHSYEHSVYTCRILSVTVFALICAAGKFCGREE